VGDVYSKSVDAAIEPEPKDIIELGTHFLVLPIEVGL